MRQCGWRARMKRVSSAREGHLRPGLPELPSLDDAGAVRRLHARSGRHRHVRAALAQSGLTIETVAADGRSIDVSASAATIERAFGSPVHSSRAPAKPSRQQRPDRHSPVRRGLWLPPSPVWGRRAPQPFALRQTDRSRAVRSPCRFRRPRWAAGANGSPLSPYLTDNCYPGYTRPRARRCRGRDRPRRTAAGERILCVRHGLWRVRLRCDPVACPLRSGRCGEPRDRRHRGRRSRSWSPMARPSS